MNTSAGSLRDDGVGQSRLHRTPDFVSEVVRVWAAKPNVHLGHELGIRGQPAVHDEVLPSTTDAASEGQIHPSRCVRLGPETSTLEEGSTVPTTLTSIRVWQT